MELIIELTFTPLHRGRFSCNQLTDSNGNHLITKSPKKFKRAYYNKIRGEQKAAANMLKKTKL
jgi:hypothetical protein